MPNRPPQKNSMKIDREYDKDPLRPKTYNVLVETAPGEFQKIGDTAEPIEMLRLNVEKNHCFGLKQTKMVIVDESRTVVAEYPSFYPPHIHGLAPDDPIRTEFRDKWLDAMMKFLLPPELFERSSEPEAKAEIEQSLAESKVVVMVRDDGGAVKIFRDGVILSEWGE